MIVLPVWEGALLFCRTLHAPHGAGCRFPPCTHTLSPQSQAGQAHTRGHRFFTNHVAGAQGPGVEQRAKLVNGLGATEEASLPHLKPCGEGGRQGPQGQGQISCGTRVSWPREAWRHRVRKRPSCRATHAPAHACATHLGPCCILFRRWGSRRLCHRTSLACRTCPRLRGTPRQQGPWRWQGSWRSPRAAC